MLNQQSDSQELSAGQMRVKKEEFARAIAALESRRQTEAQEREGTVVIGDVLQQLQINLPAEEVLQEIEALQAGKPRQEQRRRSFWNANRAYTAKTAAIMFLIPLIAVAIAVKILNPLNSPALSSPAFPPPASGVFMPWMMPIPPNSPVRSPVEVMDESGFNASSVVKPLSSVPDNQPVHCTSASLDQLLASYNPSSYPYVPHSGRPFGEPDPSVLARSSQLFDVRPNLHKPWILIKHGGKLYVRGWVSARFTPAQALGQYILLHSARHSFDVGVQPVQITLLLNFTHYSSQGQEWEEFQPKLVAGDVTLDPHAWEPW